jgi:phosphate/sulfate permease
MLTVLDVLVGLTGLVPLVLMLIALYRLGDEFGVNYLTLGIVLSLIGAVLLMLGSSILLIMHLTSTSYVVTMIGMGIAFLGDVSISLFFWRASQGDVFIKVGAVLNVVPVVTFIGSLLLAIGIDSVKDIS